MSVDTEPREPVTQHVMYENGKDIHLEMTTGYQSSVPRLDTTNDELLAKVGPTTSNIAECNLSTHEHWPVKIFCLLLPLLHWRVPYSE